MLTSSVKHVIKVIFVIIVIAGLLASYIFTGAPRQAQPITEEITNETINFAGPEEEPVVTEPSTVPAVSGPTTPPPASQ